MIETEYYPKSNEIMKHFTSMANSEVQEEKMISLEDCLTKFFGTEKLQDQLYCSGCQDHMYFQKNLMNFRPPPVLVIQLKRFKSVDGVMRKLQTYVDFPLENLDLSPFIQDFEFISKLDLPSIYDLHGIINHYGSLTFGHYTSFVRNPFDKQWYKYDD